MTDAYKEGKAAYYSGYDNTANPYKFGTAEFTEWFDGYHDAQWADKNL